MFLVKDKSATRERRIKKLLTTNDAAIAVILAVVHFEWTIRRAIVSLADEASVVIRNRLGSVSGLSGLLDAWDNTTFKGTYVEKPATSILGDSAKGLKSAFNLRNKLVHGLSSTSLEHARSRVHEAIEASCKFRGYCKTQGIDLDSKLQVKRRKFAIAHVSRYHVVGKVDARHLKALYLKSDMGKEFKCGMETVRPDKRVDWEINYPIGARVKFGYSTLNERTNIPESPSFVKVV